MTARRQSVSPARCWRYPRPEAPPNVLRRQATLLRLLEATPIAVVTPALIGVNLVVWVVMILAGVGAEHPDPRALIVWGADYGPLTHDQWWRLFTAMFLHMGVIHLASNMIVLWQVGSIAERLFGRVGFIALYALSGLAGSVASVAWHPDAVSAGASGAIFGVCGGLLGFLLVARGSVPESLGPQLMSGAGFMALGLIYGFWDSNIDLVGHIGGFVSGVGFGYALTVVDAVSLSAARRLRTAIVTLAGAALIAAAASRIPAVDDLVTEVTRMSELETIDVRLYNDTLKRLKSGALTPEEFASIISNKILPPWTAARDRLSSLRLSSRQRAKATQLAGYMSLRAESWQLTADGVLKQDVSLIQAANDKTAEAQQAMQAFNAR